MPSNGSRYQELEKQLGLVSAQTVRRPRTKKPRVKAYAVLNYAVPGTIAIERQPTTMTCWATVTTMMLEWSQQQSMSIETALGTIAKVYVDKFRKNEGLSISETPAFLAAAGLVHQPPMNPTADGFDTLLRNYGPLWITTGHDRNGNLSAHARLAVGIRGDGTETGTELDLIDPGDASRRWVKLNVLREDFERFVVGNVRRWVEIIHFPADAKHTVARSLGMILGLSAKPIDPVSSTDDAGSGYVHSTGLYPARALVAPAVVAGAGAVEIANLGIAVFQLGREIFLAGDLKFSSQGANYVHQNTPAELPTTRVTAEFPIVAKHDIYGESTFWFRLSFEHNGFDVKDATIGLLEDKSSRMVSSTFEVNFAPRSYSLPSDPICELKFDISGRYDPFGPGVSSFQGQLRVKADGKTFLALTSENNAVVAGRFFHVKTQALFPRSTTPNSIDVYFGVGSDRVDERSIRAIRAWFDQLSTAARQQVTLGLIPVALDAFASTTGSAAVNQALAQRRAAAVERILRDFAGSNAQFKTTVHGELAAKTGDRVEDARERRVTISVKSFN